MVEVSGDDELLWALRGADPRTLGPVLAHLTGDLAWVRPPYLSEPQRGLSLDGPPSIADDVRRRMVAAARSELEVHVGGAEALPSRAVGTLTEILSASMGEAVPPEYEALIRHELEAPERLDVASTSTVASERSVCIIGGGMSGICAAVALARRGIPFVLLERSDNVGGSWLDNHYPGAGVDTPGHLYAYSFAPHDWTMHFPLQEELQEYFASVAREFGVMENARFGADVEEVRYSEADALWDVTYRDRATGDVVDLRVPFVVSAIGAFNTPHVPTFDGMDDFAGRIVHTARWPSDLDVTGSRVAVIGNGASAMQVVPAIVDSVESLAVFQRSPQWVAPFEDFRVAISEESRWLMANVPAYRLWRRIQLGWLFNDRIFAALHADPLWPHPDRSLNVVNNGHRRFFSRYIASEIATKQDLLSELIPSYPPYGKRMLLDNGWYAALDREHVELYSDGASRISRFGVVSGSEREFEADVIVLATGFQASKFLGSFEVYGRGGLPLRKEWEAGGDRAYLGIAVPEFPNFFMLYGPNTQPGHGGSVTFFVERQVEYIASILDQMAAKGVSVVECPRDTYEAYNDELQSRHEQMIWTHPQVSTYYRNAVGRVVVPVPYRVVDWLGLTAEPSLDDFVV